MGFRFRRSIGSASGVRLNLTKTGIGVSAGRPGARVSVHSSGRRTASVGIPGSGLSYRIDGHTQAPVRRRGPAQGARLTRAQRRTAAEQAGITRYGREDYLARGLSVKRSLIALLFIVLAGGLLSTVTPLGVLCLLAALVFLTRSAVGYGRHRLRIRRARRTGTHTA